MKQTDLERINRIVLAPLGAIYGNYGPEMAEMFFEDLAEFDNATLEQAVKTVRRSRNTQPKISHLVEACREAKGDARSGANDATGFYATMLRRNDEARKMASDYVREYEFCPIARKASGEGWLLVLMRYVYEAAWLQAQYILDVPNPGYGLTPFAARDHAETERRCRELVRSSKRQAATGMIEVSIPDHLIEEWKAAAALDLARITESQKPKPMLSMETPEVPLPPKTEIELEIDRQIQTKGTAA